MIIGFPVLVTLLVIVFTTFGIPNGAIFFIAVPYIIYAFASSFKFSYAACPACDKPMFHKHYFFYGLSKCVHCGYSLKDISTSSKHNA